jgi:hypothetical protein
MRPDRRLLRRIKSYAGGYEGVWTHTVLLAPTCLQCATRSRRSPHLKITSTHRSASSICFILMTQSLQDRLVSLPCGPRSRALIVFAGNHSQLIELGYRGAGDTLKREEFEARKKADREKYLHKEAAPKPLASTGKDLSANPLLQALAAREELVRGGKLTCIIFVRDFNPKGQEISGYIDLAHRYCRCREGVHFELHVLA